VSIENVTFTAGQAAHQAGISRKALRVYLERELLAETERTSAGYRLYTRSDVAVLCFIRQARNLGLHLDDIVDILAIHRGGGPPCARRSHRHPHHRDRYRHRRPPCIARHPHLRPRGRPSGVSARQLRPAGVGVRDRGTRRPGLTLRQWVPESPGDGGDRVVDERLQPSRPDGGFGHPG